MILSALSPKHWLYIAGRYYAVFGLKIRFVETQKA
jgi:hypothetical protein